MPSEADFARFLERADPDNELGAGFKAAFRAVSTAMILAHNNWPKLAAEFPPCPPESNGPDTKS